MAYQVDTLGADGKPFTYKAEHNQVVAILKDQIEQSGAHPTVASGWAADAADSLKRGLVVKVGHHTTISWAEEK